MAIVNLVPPETQDISVTVPGHGPVPAKLALVSEHPGPDEIKHKLPFVGPSGYLLNRLLTLSGIRRSAELTKNNLGRMEMVVDSEIYTTNIIKRALRARTFEEECYEPPIKRRHPNLLLSAAIKALETELRGVGANLVIACGDHALQALTGKRGITKWRGSIVESTLIPGLKVLPIIHPAATLKDYSTWPLTRFDLERALKESAFKEIRRPTYTFNTLPTIEDVREFGRRCMAGDFEALAFDIETKANHIACLGFAWSTTDALCIPFISKKDCYWQTVGEEREVWQIISRIFANDKIKLIGQNVLFDLTHLAAHSVWCKRPHWDTMLAQSVIYPELEKSLAVLCSIHTSQPYYKDMGKLAFKKTEKAWSNAQTDFDLREYNCLDCVVTFSVYLEQVRDFDKIVRGWFRTL